MNIPILNNLPATIAQIKSCWLNAEKKVRSLISTKYHAHDEVFITRLLYGELSEELNNINSSGLFEKCFLSDLKLTFQDRELEIEVNRISRGIMARITYHEPHMEKISGADFGLSVIRPRIWQTPLKSTLNFDMHQQGLLCQAKRQKVDGTIGFLTDNQKKVISEHLAYYALLFYFYRDNDRSLLQPFLWSNSKWTNINDIEEYIDCFFELSDAISSGDILSYLGNGQIGTDNQEIIKTIICPETQPHIKVEITWADGFPPPPPPPPSGGSNLRNLSKHTGNNNNIGHVYSTPAIQNYIKM